MLQEGKVTEQEAQATEETVEQEEEGSQTFDASYVKQLRDENASRRKKERELEKKLEQRDQEAEEAKQAELSEVERLKNSDAKKDERIKELEAEARSLKINNLALSRVSAVGGKAERAGRIMQLADFSGVEVTDGSPDSEAIDAALKAVLEDVTEFKAQAQNTGGGGSNPASGSGNTTERNPWSAEHRNLTEQGRIQRENPELADRLRREAS